MCLIIDPKEHVALKYKVAKKDITCYKILTVYPDSDDLYTPFRNIRIVSKQLVCDKFQTKPCSDMGNYTIDHGIHTVVDKFLARTWVVMLAICNQCNPNVKYRNINVKLFNCIIPKGTKYWINTCTREACSEKIILQDEIQWIYKNKFKYSF